MTSPAARYAQQLAKSDFRNWAIKYRQLVEEDVISRLVLVHPDWYSHLPGAKTVRGPRRFAVADANHFECQSQDIFGYECPFETPQMSVDHIFPWGLGGPTVPSNSAWLCLLHNQWKGIDYRWANFGEGEPWLEGTLRAIAALHGLTA